MKQEHKQHAEDLKELSNMGMARLSELDEKAEESEAELKSQREALDKVDGMICDGLYNAGTIATRCALALSKSNRK